VYNQAAGMFELPAKSALRRKLRLQRLALKANDVRERSVDVIRHVESLPIFADAPTVFIYIAHNNEVDTHGLIQDLLAAGRDVVVPRVTLEQDQPVMHLYVLHNWADLAPGIYGIPEPPDDVPFTATPDVIVVPGLAFTRDGHRLGLGGGFYDRYLAEHADVPTIGLCLSEFLHDQLPTEKHDATVDVVVTDDATYGASFGND